MFDDLRMRYRPWKWVVAAVMMVAGGALTPLARADWEVVGTAGFSAGSAPYTSLAFYNGEPYVAYLDAANSNKATVMRYTGGSWQTVGAAGFSAGTATYISLAFYNGEPYVAHQDGGNSGKATVKRYTGGSWQTVGAAGFSAGMAFYTSLAFENGEPYVAYQDAGNSNKATVMRYTSGSWQTVGAAGFSAGAAYYTSLAFYNGEPYVAYRDGGNSNKATVVRYTGGSWQTVGTAGFSAGSAGYTSLTFYNGEPYVAYQDGGTSSKATVQLYTGGSWQTVGAAGFSAGNALFTSLAFYNGEPYVAYLDGGTSSKATVKRYTSGSWQTVGTAGFSANEADYTSLAIYNGAPYVAYQDVGNSFKATVMRYPVPPTTQATNVTFSSVGAAVATIDWTRGNGSVCAAFITQASSGSAAPANNTTYTADTAFGAGAQIGATGWYCVYNGSGTNVAVTSLSPGTTYRVMVCEYDGAAGNEQYLADTAAGNPANVTTAAAPGITVTPTSGLITTEAGGTDTFDVVLDSQPTAYVIIDLSSSDTTEGTVSPARVTFTSGNWSTPQTVTVTGVDDDVDDGDIAYTIVTAAATSGDGNYNSMNASDVSVTNTDDDTAGITVNPTNGLVTTEAGGTETFDVVLDTQPTANVIIDLSSSDTTEGTVSPASLTFTSANWNTPQTVTVTGVDDFVQDGDIGYTIVTAAATSVDGNYNGLNASDVSVTNTDDDTAGITVTPTSGLTTTEAGGMDTFDVVLDAQPTANVIIDLSSSNTAEGTVAPASLTFTSGNWNTLQTVTVTGVDDALDDGNIAYTIITAAATSVDGNYNGLNASDVSVTNTDDDVVSPPMDPPPIPPAAGTTISPTSGLITTEAGGAARFTIVLDTQPTANVTIGLSSSDTAEGTVSPASVTFTSANWNVAQAVTVTGVDDQIEDGDVVYTIATAAAVSADPAYNGMDPADVSVTNADDDTGGITVNPTSGLVTTEAGGMAQFTIVLNTQPTADVSIGTSSSKTAEGTVTPASLKFTPTNWSMPRTVTITGVDDQIEDGDVVYTIVTAAAVSADPAYNGIDPADVSVTNADDDTAGITVNPTSGLVTTEAGGTAQFAVVLNAQPTADVAIGLSSSYTAEGTVAPASLTFTSTNWNTPQTVTLTGVDDAVADGDVAYTVLTAAAASADPTYNGMKPADVSVTNTDDDTAGITVTLIGGVDTSGTNSRDDAAGTSPEEDQSRHYQLPLPCGSGSLGFSLITALLLQLGGMRSKKPPHPNKLSVGASRTIVVPVGSWRNKVSVGFKGQGDRPR